MWAYYNEHDEEKSAWIRELIKAKVVTDGEVDCRDIKFVTADDVRGFRRVHFFAGIAVWDYALNLAGWGDREVWTGSCPCPSFSCAGKGEGFDDPRHLWPTWFKNLIRVCRPGTVFGEQADGAIGHGWLDLVSGDMEAEGYAFAAAVLGAHSVGAPHRRHRLYFVGERGESAGRGRAPGRTSAEVYRQEPCGEAERSGDALSRPNTPDARRDDSREHGSGPSLFAARPEQRGAGIVADTERNGRRTDLTLRIAEGRIVDGRDSAVGERDHSIGSGLEGHRQHVGNRGKSGWLSEEQTRLVAEAGATRGFWADCDWWYGRDGRYRPIKPGLFPLAHGVAARVLKLRGAGDAIVAPLAAEFIQAYLETKG